MPDLEHVTISICEPNGDGIMTYNVNNTISAMIPNVGDEVYVEFEGRYREVLKKTFVFLENIRTIQVLIYLKD